MVPETARIAAGYLSRIGRQRALGKEVRWEAETKIAPHLTGTVFSRNQLMDELADWYLDHSDATTDILHEYFLSRDGSVPFLRQARTIIRAHRADLLNVTVREVQTDSDTFLRYADQPMIAFVMFFSQRRAASADREMEQMTREPCRKPRTVRVRCFYTIGITSFARRSICASSSNTGLRSTWLTPAIFSSLISSAICCGEPHTAT
jgi:hypothetical protein